MKILLLLASDIPFVIFCDHLYQWFASALLPYGADVKVLFFEVDGRAAGDLGVSNQFDVKKLSNKELAQIFGSSDFKRLYAHIHFEGMTAQEQVLLKNAYRSKFGSWEPDVIVSQGYRSASKVFGNIFKNALCLAHENAIFSRPPFSRTLALDLYDSVSDNFLVRFAPEIKAFKITPEENEQTERFKRALTRLIDKRNELAGEMDVYKKKFRKLVLLPLVGNKFVTLFKDCVCGDELELLEYVMRRTPADIGVFVTQPDSWASLTPEDVQRFSARYPNFIYLSKTDNRGYANNSLNYFKYIDAVLNITSKAALMAMLWDKPVVSLAKTYNRWFQDGQDMMELEQTLSRPYQKKNHLLYWYFTRYVIFEQDLSQPGFLWEFLQQQLERYRKDSVTFSFYDGTNDFDGVTERVLRPVQDFYACPQRCEKQRFSKRVGAWFRSLSRRLGRIFKRAGCVAPSLCKRNKI